MHLLHRGSTLGLALALALATALALCVAPATAAGGPGATRGDDLVRLRITLEASGLLATVRLADGARVVNARVVRSAHADTYWDARGLLVQARDSRPAGTPARAVFEAIVAGLPTASTLWQRTCEQGPARLAVENVNDRRRPVRLARPADCPLSTTAAIDGRLARRNGPLLVEPGFGAGTVFAHYVPWYYNGEYSSYNNAPLDPSGATSDPGYVGRTIDEARGAGIDGFTVTTYGLPHTQLDVYMQQAAQRPGWVTVWQLATRIANPQKRWEFGTQPAELVRWIAGLMSRYGDHPSLLRTPDGRVVFLAYWAPTLTLEQWRGVVTGVEQQGYRIALVGEQVRPDWLTVFAGDYVFNSLVFDDLPATYRRRSEIARTWHLLHPGAERKVWMAAVAPGMNDSNPDTGRRYVDRRGGALYREQWATASASRPDWRMIVSWNDFGEDTVISPSRAWGHTYLDLTRELIRDLGPRG